MLVCMYACFLAWPAFMSVVEDQAACVVSTRQAAGSFDKPRPEGEWRVKAAIAMGWLVLGAAACWTLKTHS